MKTILLPLSLIIFVYLTGCSSPPFISSGEDTQVFDGQSLAHVSRVVLLPLSLSQYSEKSDVDTSPLTDSLWKALETKRFVSLVPMDSVRSVIQQLHKSDSLSELRICSVLSADAFIRSEIIYAIPPIYGKTYTATLMLIINNVTLHKALAFCSFDTYKGKHYLLPPKVEQTTIDAIEGAARTLANVVNKSRGNP